MKLANGEAGLHGRSPVEAQANRPTTLARPSFVGGLTVGWFLLLTLMGAGMGYFGLRAGPGVSRRRKQQFLSYGLILAGVGLLGFVLSLLF